ncbi:MAG: hypothetical protein K0B52_02255, partial [FCB group bacterium]|nr:hypothetical protein [FCB group bacterium]
MKKNVKSEDIYRLIFVSEPQMSPKGDRIVYVKKRSDKKDQCYYSNLQSIHVQSKHEHIFTEEGKHQDMMPRINPNGKQVVFLRIKEGIPELRSISMYGGESRKLADFPHGDIRNIRFSPDGKQIAVLFAKRNDHIPYENEKRKEPVCRETDRLYYRLDGHGFIDEEPAQIYLLRASGGTPKKITDCAFDIGTFVWSADARILAYTCIDHAEPELHMEEEDIFLLNITDGKTTKLIKPAGPVGFLRFSPDDTILYFSGHFNPHYSWGADNMDIHALNLNDGKITNLSGKLDRTTDMLTLGDITPSFVPQNPVIAGGTMYFTVSSKGTNPLYALDLGSGELQTVLEGPECVIAYSASEDGRQMALHLAQLERPDEIWHFSLDDEKRLTRLSFNNEKYIDDTDFRTAQAETVKVKNTGIDMFVQLPPDFN